MKDLGPGIDRAIDQGEKAADALAQLPIKGAEALTRPGMRAVDTIIDKTIGFLDGTMRNIVQRTDRGISSAINNVENTMSKMM